MPRSLLTLVSVLSVAFVSAPSIQAQQVSTGLQDANPRVNDERLKIELFAEHPDIVTPTGIAVDRQGRVFVAESHTHFRPDDYQGPERDRILMMVDENDDGRADQVKVFHEGFTHVMDIAFHQDGSLYVATRMDIHRLEDRDQNDVADRVSAIIKLDTTGTYPHNGISGLAFDFHGRLNFGLGENLGHAYRLLGTDDVVIKGGGEGGSTYRVNADGTALRRISTGWWNPFGLTVDVFGRVFGTDNDPGASPPCRLIQVVPGGDYGYEYRYGRTGLHPLVSWTGDRPGVLPMISGTGEAPCGIEAYESTALPPEYRGRLLVPCWADHRIEMYDLRWSEDTGLVSTQRGVMVEGGNEFRPVDVSTAPDGTIYFTDWVSASYTLHRLGRVWRIRPQSSPTVDQAGISSLDRWTREAAARELAKSAAGRRQLEEVALRGSNLRVRVAALHALASVDKAERNSLLEKLSADDQPMTIRWSAWSYRATDKLESVSLQRLPRALQGLVLQQSPSAVSDEQLRVALRDFDPLVSAAAAGALARRLDKGIDAWAADYPAAVLLAARHSPAVGDSLASDGRLDRMFLEGRPDVRYLVVKWIGDEKLTEYAPTLEKWLHSETIDYMTFRSIFAALDRLEDRNPTDHPSSNQLLALLRSNDVAEQTKVWALRELDPTSRQFKLAMLDPLLQSNHAEVRRQAVWALSGHQDPGRVQRLIAIAEDSTAEELQRCVAIMGLAAIADNHKQPLLRWAGDGPDAVSREALRALVGVSLTSGENNALRRLAKQRPALREAVQRVVGESFARPAKDNVDQWMALVQGEANVEAGKRVFFHSKVGTCGRCHQFHGRGIAVGPALTRIHTRAQDRKWMLDTILNPSREMAPEYTPWQIITQDGQVLTGLPRRKGGSAEAYLGADGKEFSVKKSNIESHQEMRVSLMPDDLLNQLTRRELRDLFAFLSKNTQSTDAKHK